MFFNPQIFVLFISSVFKVDFSLGKIDYPNMLKNFMARFSKSGLELPQVPRVPGTRGIFGQYCLASADFGNFTTKCCASPF